MSNTVRMSTGIAGLQAAVDELNSVAAVQLMDVSLRMLHTKELLLLTL